MNPDSAAFDGFDLQVVRDANAFSAALQGRSPDSIWIHRTALDMVDPAPLQRLKRQGVVMVGIDTTLAQLARVLGATSGPTGHWRTPTTPIFVIYWERGSNAVAAGVGG